MYRYYCSNCNDYFVTYYKKEKSKSRKYFCGRKCYNDYKVKNGKSYFFTCKQCTKQIPCKKWKAENRVFCNNDCYNAYKADNSEEYLTDKFITEGRKHSNTEEAIEKGKETKFRNGTITDWKKNKEWKKFYKECNRLNLLMREEMINSWDGYDYYTGKYIKDNLKLPYFHKEYPTLDHKFPKSRAFEQGKTPKEITTKDNLVWTTRSNNSKKGNKVTFKK